MRFSLLQAVRLVFSFAQDRFNIGHASRHCDIFIQGVCRISITRTVGVAHDAAIDGPEGVENFPHDNSILIHVQIHRRDTFLLKHINGYVLKTHVLHLDFTVLSSKRMYCTLTT